MFISLFSLDKGVAIIIPVSIITMFFMALFPFLSRAIDVKEKLSEIYNKTSNMYVFEYTFGEPIESESYQSRYLVDFNYNDINYKLMTNWIYDINDLDNKKVSLGYIESINLIIVLKEL